MQLGHELWRVDHAAGMPMCVEIRKHRSACVEEVNSVVGLLACCMPIWPEPSGPFGCTFEPRCPGAIPAEGSGAGQDLIRFGTIM